MIPKKRAELRSTLCRGNPGYRVRENVEEEELMMN
jgi:hypothetical protein